MSTFTPAGVSGDYRTGYIPTLDGWRAIAILMVLADHTLNHLAKPLQLARWHLPPALGLHGVTVFFVLSGFLITSRLLQEWHKRGRISLRHFYIRRAFRILPAALVVLMAIGLLGLLGLIPVGGHEFFSTLAFVRNYATSISPSSGSGFFTAHYWSLAVEEHFYLVWPAVLVIALHRRSALITCLVLAITLATWSAYRYSVETRGLANATWAYFTHTDTQLHTLLWGAAAAIALELYAQPRRWARQFLTPTVWIALGVLYVALWAVFGSHPTAAEAIVIGLLIAGTSCRPGDTIGRALEWRPIRVVGRVSYSLYLTNNVLLPFAWLGTPLGLVHTFPINIALTVAFSIALYWGIERPMIRIGNRLAPPASAGSRSAQAGLSHMDLDANGDLRQRVA